MQKFISHVLDANRADTKMENGNRYGIYWMEGVQRSLLQEETKVRGGGRELLVHAKSTQLRSPGVKTGCETQNSSTFGARVWKLNGKNVSYSNILLFWKELYNIIKFLQFLKNICELFHACSTPSHPSLLSRLLKRSLKTLGFGQFVMNFEF